MQVEGGTTLPRVYRTGQPARIDGYEGISGDIARHVTRYAQASSVSVRVGCEDGRATVEVANDGCGGADASRGSGLRGLIDRRKRYAARSPSTVPPAATPSSAPSSRRHEARVRL